MDTQFYRDKLNEYITTLSSTQLRQLTNIVYDEVSNDILIQPSSMSGNYHPEDECGENGLAKHLVRCCIVGDYLANSESLPIDERDIVIAGCLMHDVPNRVVLSNGKLQTDKNHAFFNAINALNKYRANISDGLVVQQNIMKVVAAIFYHEGKWTIKQPDRFLEDKVEIYKHTVTTKLVHFADYIASRRNIIVRIDGDVG